MDIFIGQLRIVYHTTRQKVQQTSHKVVLQSVKFSPFFKHQYGMFDKTEHQLPIFVHKAVFK